MRVSALRRIAATPRIAAYRSTGLPGVSLGRTRRLLRALRPAQRLEDDGAVVVPPTPASGSAAAAAPPASP